MKQVINLFILFSGMYYIAVLAVATWSMYEINNTSQIQTNEGNAVHYCLRYLSIFLIFSIEFWILNCLALLDKIKGRLKLVFIVSSYFFAFIFYGMATSKEALLNSIVYGAIIDSIFFYLILMVFNSFLVILSSFRKG